MVKLSPANVKPVVAFAAGAGVRMRKLPVLYVLPAVGATLALAVELPA